MLALGSRVALILSRSPEASIVVSCMSQASDEDDHRTLQKAEQQACRGCSCSWTKRSAIKDALVFDHCPCCYAKKLWCQESLFPPCHGATEHMNVSTSGEVEIEGDEALQGRNTGGVLVPRGLSLQLSRGRI